MSRPIEILPREGDSSQARYILRDGLLSGKQQRTLVAISHMMEEDKGKEAVPALSKLLASTTGKDVLKNLGNLSKPEKVMLLKYANEIDVQHRGKESGETQVNLRFIDFIRQETMEIL